MRTVALLALGLLAAAPLACGGSTKEISEPVANGGGAGSGGSVFGEPGGGAGHVAHGGAAQGGSGGESPAGAGGESGGAAGSAGGGDAGTTSGYPNVFDGGIISHPGNSWVDAETHLAVSKTGVIVASWNAESNTTYMGYAFSLDGGTTWTKPAAVYAPGNRQASDPVVAFDDAGNAYLAFIGFDYGGGNPVNMGVFAAKAPAGSTTFGPPSTIVDSDGMNVDKPWITVSQNGTILVSYAHYQQPGPTDEVVAWSKDGETWNNVVASPSNGGFKNLGYLCHSTSTARVWLVYWNLFDIEVRYSDDEGVTWTGSGQADGAGENVAFDDPTCAGDGNDLFVSYGLSPDDVTSTGATSPRLTSIRVAHSTGGGGLFKQRFDAHDPAAGKYFAHASIIREDDGSLDLTYYAGQKESDYNGTFRRARSTDGATFGASLPLHDAVFTVDRASPSWLGDYEGIAWYQGNLFIAMTDNSVGFARIRFLKTPAN